jgi:hypothetical protein
MQLLVQVKRIQMERIAPPCTYRQLLNALHLAVIKDDGETCRTTPHTFRDQLSNAPLAALLAAAAMHAGRVGIHCRS